MADPFAPSEHGRAPAAAEESSPTCLGWHAGPITSSLRSGTAAELKLAQEALCLSCHLEDPRVHAKMGSWAGLFGAYEKSVRGGALRSGNEKAAGCVECHGSHAIKPSSDPTSSVSKGSLAATCGRRHPGANDPFAEGAVHVTSEKAGDEPILSWIASLYITPILTTVGAMLVHNLLDFAREWRRERLVRMGVIEEEAAGRAAAVVMITASLWHMEYLALTNPGRALFRDLLPRPADVRESLRMVGYNMGLTRRRPLFGRFSYVEKAEHWALVWGTLVMAGAPVWCSGSRARSSGSSESWAGTSPGRSTSTRPGSPRSPFFCGTFTSSASTPTSTR